MEEDKTDYRTLGIVFLIAGFGLAISLGVTVGPAFMPSGLALIIVGAVFLTKNNAEDDQ
ncbi:MAG: hypothetical protein ABJN35_03620 [Erythrobacter sp.]